MTQAVLPMFTKRLGAMPRASPYPVLNRPQGRKPFLRPIDLLGLCLWYLSSGDVIYMWSPGFGMVPSSISARLNLGLNVLWEVTPNNEIPAARIEWHTPEEMEFFRRTDTCSREPSGIMAWFQAFRRIWTKLDQAIGKSTPGYFRVSGNSAFAPNTRDTSGKLVRAHKAGEQYVQKSIGKDYIDMILQRIYPSRRQMAECGVWALREPFQRLTRVLLPDPSLWFWIIALCCHVSNFRMRTIGHNQIRTVYEYY